MIAFATDPPLSKAIVARLGMVVQKRSFVKGTALTIFGSSGSVIRLTMALVKLAMHGSQEAELSTA